MKTNLMKILWKKECKHWRNIGSMFKRFNSIVGKLTFGLIVATVLIICHYAMALMHILYEVSLYIFARKTFKANLEKLALTV